MSQNISCILIYDNVNLYGLKGFRKRPKIVIHSFFFVHFDGLKPYLT